MAEFICPSCGNNLYIQARNAKKSGDYAGAFHYYQQILAMEPNNWEAAFYTNT